MAAPKAGAVSASAPAKRPDPAKFTTLPPPVEESEEWIISYMDMVTLLMVVFLGMVAILGVKNRAPDAAAKKAASGAPNRATGEGALAQGPSLDGGPIAVLPAIAITGLPVPSAPPPSAGGEPLPAGGEEGGGEALSPNARDLLNQLEAAGRPAGLDVIVSDRKLTIAIKDRILFASGKADLAAPGRQLLRAVAHSLRALTGVITVEGHTDDVAIATARFPTNWELSSARATAVVRELIADGVEPGRLRAVGYADTKPLDPHDRAANRRVTIVVER
ncbi:OmpA family protein [Nitrospirillum pindoramense]|nr:OmpA family protein [Nitrospirillum amazonense]